MMRTSGGLLLMGVLLVVAGAAEPVAWPPLPPEAVGWTAEQVYALGEGSSLDCRQGANVLELAGEVPAAGTRGTFQVDACKSVALLLKASAPGLKVTAVAPDQHEVVLTPVLLAPPRNQDGSQLKGATAAPPAEAAYQAVVEHPKAGPWTLRIDGGAGAAHVTYEFMALFEEGQIRVMRPNWLIGQVGDRLPMIVDVTDAAFAPLALAAGQGEVVIVHNLPGPLAGPKVVKEVARRKVPVTKGQPWRDALVLEQPGDYTVTINFVATTVAGATFARTMHFACSMLVRKAWLTSPLKPELYVTTAKGPPRGLQLTSVLHAEKAGFYMVMARLAYPNGGKCQASCTIEAKVPGDYPVALKFQDGCITTGVVAVLREVDIFDQQTNMPLYEGVLRTFLPPWPPPASGAPATLPSTAPSSTPANGPPPVPGAVGWTAKQVQAVPAGPLLADRQEADGLRHTGKWRADGVQWDFVVDECQALRLLVQANTRALKITAVGPDQQAVPVPCAAPAGQGQVTALPFYQAVVQQPKSGHWTLHVAGGKETQDGWYTFSAAFEQSLLHVKLVNPQSLQVGDATPLIVEVTNLADRPLALAEGHGEVVLAYYTPGKEPGTEEVSQVAQRQVPVAKGQPWRDVVTCDQPGQYSYDLTLIATTAEGATFARTLQASFTAVARKAWLTQPLRASILRPSPGAPPTGLELTSTLHVAAASTYSVMAYLGFPDGTHQSSGGYVEAKAPGDYAVRLAYPRSMLQSGVAPMLLEVVISDVNAAENQKLYQDTPHTFLLPWPAEPASTPAAAPTTPPTPPAAQPAANAPASGAPAATYRLWIYPGGFVVERGGGAWTEHNNGGNYGFKEVARTTDFIELYDQSRDCSVRLYADRLMVKGMGKFPVFTKFYDGAWLP